MSAASRAPAEIIRRICEELSPLGSAVANRKDVMAVALVCRRWAPEAQATLWRSVRLQRKDKAEAFIKMSTPRRFQTRALTLYGSDSDKQRINPTLAYKVISATRGVRSLHLSGVKGANGGLLLHPNLGDLVKLDFNNTIAMNETKLAATPDPTYQLSELRTTSWTFKPEVKIFTPIFRASATSLTFMDVNVTDKTISTPSFNALHSLTALENYAFVLFMDTTYLPTLLPGLNSFSVSLKKLSLCRFHDADNRIILQALATPAAVSLAMLQMSGSSAEQIAAEVKKVCRTRSIRIAIADGRAIAL